MIAKEWFRSAVRHAGFDIRRFPVGHPTHDLVSQLAFHAITCVFDVGANEGGYARSLRKFGYRGRIVSFEPVADAFARARRAAARDRAWEVVQLALGAETTTATINVAGNGGHSSSLLTMLREHERVQPSAAYVRTEVVEQRAFDEVAPTLLSPDDRVLLKLDVQGYERQVLEGAEATLARGAVHGLQLEMSFVPLYDGGWLYDETLAWARGRGFELTRIIPGFTDHASGRMLQADGLFFRPYSGAGRVEPISRRFGVPS